MNKQTFLTLLATFALLFSFTFSCHAKGKDKAKHAASTVGTFLITILRLPFCSRRLHSRGCFWMKPSSLPNASLW